MANNAENVSIWWRHHDTTSCCYNDRPISHTPLTWLRQSLSSYVEHLLGGLRKKNYVLRHCTLLRRNVKYLLNDHSLIRTVSGYGNHGYALNHKLRHLRYRRTTALTRLQYPCTWTRDNWALLKTFKQQFFVILNPFHHVWCQKCSVVTRR